MNKRLTPQTFEDLAIYVQNLMGIHLEKNLNSFLRAKQVGDIKYVSHRLAYLYNQMIEARTTTKLSPPSGNFISVMELSIFKTLIEEFKMEKGWSEIKSELNSARSFSHLMNLLMFLKSQRDNKINCNFVTSNSTTKKSADIVMYTPLRDKINVEVKSPELLIQPIELNNQQVDNIIRKSWKRARKQLGTEPSILLIGGLHIPFEIIEKLQKSAQYFLDSRNNFNVAYIQIQSISATIDKPIFNNDNTFAFGKGSSLKPEIIVSNARNNNYKGKVQFYSKIQPSEKATNELSKRNSMVLDKGKIIKHIIREK